MKRRKLLILGLDGVPSELLRDFCQNSVMPNTTKLLARGRLQTMSVTLPEISAVSWSSFMTGTDAGNHGIFGFVDLMPGTYRFRFPDFSDLQLPTFFDDLGKEGIRSVVISLPATYPARDFPGVLISGFFAQHLEKAVFPPALYPMLKEMGYRVDVDAAKGKTQKMEFLADLHCCLKVKKEAADILWNRQDWDIFMFTVTETDRLHHFFYDAHDNPDHPHYNDFRLFYQEVDAIIGDFLAKMESAGDRYEIMLVSDHGFHVVSREIYLNPLLRQYHFLKGPASGHKTLEDLHPATQAFALDPSRIFINREGIYPRGSVKKKDVDRVRRDLRDLFENLTIDGTRPVQRVFFKEEIYGSRFLDLAADLILVPAPGSDLKAGMEKSATHADSTFAGMHRHDNALFFFTRPEWVPETMTIVDVKKIVERLMKRK